MRVHLCLWERGRASEWERESTVSSHSFFILPRCDVPLILIFSSQMRAILAITVHFNFSPLNISFLWYLPLTASQLYTLLTFMRLQVMFIKICLFRKINIPCASKYFISLSPCSLPWIIPDNKRLGYVNYGMLCFLWVYLFTPIQTYRLLFHFVCLLFNLTTHFSNLTFNLVFCIFPKWICSVSLFCLELIFHIDRTGVNMEWH